MSATSSLSAHRQRTLQLTHKPANHLGRMCLINPLQLQRLIDRFIIMKPDGRQHGKRQNTAHAGKICSNPSCYAKQNQRY